MRKYLSFARAGYLENVVYRFNFFFTLIANVFYIVVMYFLWQSIYGAQETLRGMTFDQVFAYMVLAGSTFILYKTYVEWWMSFFVVQGNIATQLTKPVDFQLHLLFRSLGFAFFNLTMVTLPAFVLLVFVFRADIPLGLNLIFGVLSVALAYLLSFAIDFVVGLSTFHTESIWGLSVTKETIVLVLSGAMIPLNFFPEGLRNILVYLPFQAIFNIPLTIFTNPALRLPDYLSMLGIQAFWLAVIFIGSRLLYAQTIKALTVNGG